MRSSTLRPAHQLQTGKGFARFRLVDPFQSEAHVDQDPVTRSGRVFVGLEQTEVDPASGALNVDQRQLPTVFGQHFDNLTRYS
jgi:hypothetical protein